MRIKKKTSTLMLTTAAIAVAGVAAVSFAAWQGDNDNIVARAETGSAYLFGFSDVQNDGEKLELGKLVPYDQKAGIIEGVTFVSVALPQYSVVGDYTITVAYAADTTLDFYALVGDRVNAVPDGWAPADSGDWKQVTTGGAEFYFPLADGATGAVVNEAGNETVYVSLMLVSENPADMGGEVGFNVTLATVAA